MTQTAHSTKTRAIVALLVAAPFTAACSGADSSSSQAGAGGSSSLAGTSSSSQTGGAPPANSGGANGEIGVRAETTQELSSGADCLWESVDATRIELDTDPPTVTGVNAAFEGATLKISASGTYVIHGTLTDGSVIVESADEGLVQLVLQDAKLESSSGAPLFVSKAARVALIAEGQNALRDAEQYGSLVADTDEPNAALFSKAPLTVCGSGTLAIAGRYNDGIASKDGLVLAGASLTVTAADDGIRGKDYVVLAGSELSVSAGGDGIKSDNDADAALGFVAVKFGEVSVVSGGDGVTASSRVLITGGTLNAITGGGSAAAAPQPGGIFGATQTVSSAVSAKGIKGLAGVFMDGGAVTVDSLDDAIHSNAHVRIVSGTLDLSAGDDGVHGDVSLGIEGGRIDIRKSYEGLESAAITIDDGVLHIVASDDGMNAAGDAESGDYRLAINGGRIVVNAEGDGLDSNAAFNVRGGVTIVNGPTGSANAALDSSSFSIESGVLVSVHTEQMADEIAGDLRQNVLRAGLGTNLAAGTLLHLQTASGQDLLTFAPEKAFRALVFSAPELINGSYQLYTGGSAIGTVNDGVYEDGAYTPGTLFSEFTVNSTLTTVGTSSSTRGPRP